MERILGADAKGGVSEFVAVNWLSQKPRGLGLDRSAQHANSAALTLVGSHGGQRLSLIPISLVLHLLIDDRPGALP